MFVTGDSSPRQVGVQNDFLKQDYAARSKYAKFAKLLLLKMNDSELQRLHKLAKYYWWHVGRRRIIRVFLDLCKLPPQARILDAGCGTGETTKVFRGSGEVWGVDISTQALEFCRKRGLKNLRQGRACDLPFEDEFFDVVAMLDVLEHVDDDRRALREVSRVLKSSGYLLLTVPACPFLWGEHDEALDHRRRYLRSELRSKLEEAGYRIERLSFAITFLFFPIVVWRLFQKAFIQHSYPKTSYVILPPWLNTFFAFLLKVEAQLLKHINLPFGVSLVCLARKEK